MREREIDDKEVKQRKQREQKERNAEKKTLRVRERENLKREKDIYIE